MNVWQPAAGETLLARVPVTFASGAAMRVRGRRWFRDTERNDIQRELDGWPEGPTHAARSMGGAVTGSALRGTALTVGVLFMAFLSAFGGNLSGPSSRSGSGSSDDPADEVEDFPVMWAAPGTIARTLPWQLDPARSKQKHYRTHLIVTDSRLVIVGMPFSERDYKRVDDTVLWETPRAAIGSIERRDFKDGDDVKVIFTDGSWCRLRTSGRDRLMRYLVDRLDFVPLDSLTPAQRETAETFASAHAPDAGPPVVTRSECGCFRVEVLAPSTTNAFFGHSTRDMVMDVDGNTVDLSQYHLEDWSLEGLATRRRLRAPEPPSGRSSPD
ncbi:hypothetical protein [Streptomyces sp. NPDC050164]|uniref:hypothetical protein n=1 Tax=Streptomyces sp. NPDC050164 TaxID=3365605 RepID=UPI00379822EE